MSISRLIAASDVLPLADFTNYIAGNWYMPLPTAVIISGSAPGAGSIRLFPGFIKQIVTLNALGLRIVTTNAGNIQAAIYANNAATGRPTGNALASTASMSTAVNTSVNAAISVQLAAGMYWFASNCDNAVAIPTNIDSGTPWASSLIGSTTQGTDLGNSTGMAGLSVSQTFGTWPDLTSASFTEVASRSIPIVQFKVASVP